MTRQNDLTGILTTLASTDDGIGFRQGFVKAWNPATGENEIVVAGASVFNMPLLSRTEGLALQVGEVVGVLRVKSQYFLLGRISVNAGEIAIRDVDGTLSLVLRRGPGGGGEFITFHENGVVHTFAGQVWDGISQEVTGQGFFVQQDNELDLLVAAASTADGPVIVRIHDINGDRVLATDDGPDGMMDRPFLEVPMYPTSSLGNWSTDSAVFDTIALGRLYVTHPYVRVQIRAWTSGGTSGQARVLVAGTQIGSTISIPNSPTAAFFDFGNMLLPAAQLAAPYSFQAIAIEVRSLTAGQLTVAIPYGVTKRGTP